MKSMPKWFLIPPAIAALLLLGSMSMQNGGTPRDAAPASAVAAPASGAPAASKGRETPALPRTPDLTQTISALAGVLLLGVGGVLLLRRLRGPARSPRGATLLTLRQSLRLSAKQAVHAIEFDDRILLVGESERGLALLDGGRLPERTADEAEVLSRGAVAPAGLAAHLDEGATPKDLVLPRPAAPQKPRLPTPPGSKPVERAPVGLADFRNLLQKAGRS